MKRKKLQTIYERCIMKDLFLIKNQEKNAAKLIYFKITKRSSSILNYRFCIIQKIKKGKLYFIAEK